MSGRHSRIDVPAMVGEKFGRVLVIEALPTYSGSSRCIGRCECGIEREFKALLLWRGDSRSCGCLNRELTAARARARCTHGHCSNNGMSRTYRSWSQMLQRCHNDKNHAFADYAGRGISVCDRWLRFENFLADMGERPDGLTLDRVDNDGSYDPGNCRWATRSQQQQNRRTWARAQADRAAYRERMAATCRSRSPS